MAAKREPHRKIKKVFTRNDFENAITSRKKTLKDLKVLQDKELLKENDYLFTLQDVIEISMDVSIGFWKNCILRSGIEGRTLPEAGWKERIKIIQEAFT